MMTIFSDWHDLGQVGCDRHRALLAEARQRRLVRQIARGGAATQTHPDDTRPIVAPQESPEERLRLRAGCTPREWQRLAFLQWLYRRGLLTD